MTAVLDNDEVIQLTVTVCSTVAPNQKSCEPVGFYDQCLIDTRVS